MNVEPIFTCHKCNQPIVKQMVSALGKAWHPEHFQCRDCEEQIEDSIFNIKSGEPVCAKCFLDKYTSTCAGCQQPIMESTINALGDSWHDACFVCSGACKRPLSDRAYYERDGKAYCKEDFDELFAVRCAKCEKPITDSSVVAMDENWHKDCFRCDRCENPITTQTFLIDGKKKICPTCS